MDIDAVRAWAAGFIDAKGCIPVKEGSFSQIIVTQKDRLPLDYLERNFGGSVRQRKDRVFVWRIGGDVARNCARTILPYVIVNVEEVKRIAVQPLTGLHYKQRAKFTFSPPYRSFDEREERSHLARRLRKEGQTLAYIGKQLNISRQRVKQILIEF